MFHAFVNTDLKHIPPIFTPEFIRNKYESQLIAKVIESNYRFCWEERAKSESVLDALIAYLNRLPFNIHGNSELSLPDFVVLGYVGRKGPKGAQLPPPKTVSGENFSLQTEFPDASDKASDYVKPSAEDKPMNAALGSTCYKAIRGLPIPCIICKKPLKYIPTPKSHDGHHHRKYHRPVKLSYVMAVNNSESSKKGLEILFSIVKSCDSVTLIHVKKIDSAVSSLSVHATER